MYIYWDSRRLGARVTVTEGHHNDNEYNGLSSPIFFLRMLGAIHLLAVLGRNVKCNCSQSFCISPPGSYCK